LTFSGGAGLNIENCVFHGWSTGISFGVAGRLHVVDTTLRDNSGNGIYLHATSGAIEAEIERTRLLRNDTGLNLQARATATIRDSLADGNYFGMVATATGDFTTNTELTVERCVASNNIFGIYGASSGFLGFATVRVSSSTITNNLVGLAQGGAGSVVSRTNNTIEGNDTDVGGITYTFSAK
jgi:hypothetical protein